MNVYLKVVNNSVEAFADLETLKFCTNTTTPDMIVDYDLWQENSSQAHLESGSIVLGPSEEESRQIRINALKRHLSETDWIASKLADSIGDEDAISMLRTKYAQELSNRAAWRQELNLLEAKQ